MPTDQSFRSGILEHFPHNSVGAEIGVWKGEWASFINDAINPKKYYLLDPWKFLPPVTRGDLDKWYDADPIIQEHQSKIAYQEELVATLKEILDNIKWRHQTIKNMIEWRKFTSGV